jgi:hypothetical protein
MVCRDWEMRFEVVVNGDCGGLELLLLERVVVL